MTLGLSSCVRDEALSAECDIIAVTPTWTESLPKGFLLGEPVIRQLPPASITFRVDSIDYSHPLWLYPDFQLSEGAALLVKSDSISHIDGKAVMDFRYTQTVAVESEDKRFTKPYTLQFMVPSPFESCDFEYFAFDSEAQHYQTLLQRKSDGSTDPTFWASGNGGYKLTGMAKTPEDYPTCFVIDAEKGSRVAKLVTRDNGKFGMQTNPKMPIAAGNLFLGEFRLSQALLAPHKATRFGFPIVQRQPLKLMGEYKYTSGSEVTNNKKEALKGQRDTCDIYAVMYEIDPANIQPLYGDNVLTSDRIVLMARIDQPGEPQTWKSFEEPFKLMPGKQIDRTRFHNKGYALTVVMTSSREGNNFQGAIGSTLYVDNIKIVWE